MKIKKIIIIKQVRCIDKIFYRLTVAFINKIFFNKIGQLKVVFESEVSVRGEAEDTTEF